MKKRSLLLLSLAMLAVPALGQSDLRDCQRITDDQERLACYDAMTNPPATKQPEPPAERPKAVKPAKQQAANAERRAEKTPPVKPSKPLEPAAEISRKRESVHAAEAPASQVREFGLPAKIPEAEIDKITATITEVSETRRGKLYIVLNDGSEWQQRDSTRMKLKAGMQVYVERGFLGAFFLSRDNLNSRIKVKRVK